MTSVPLKTWVWDSLQVLRHVSLLPDGQSISYIAHAGLGNRLRAWFFANAIAVEQRRHLVHHWIPNRFCGAVFDDLFVGGPAFQGLHRRPWRLLQVPPSDCSQHLVPSGYHTSSALILGSHWQYAAAEDWIAANLPNAALVNAFRQTVLGDEPVAHHRLGVHIRLGDFREAGQSPPLDAFIQATETLLRQQSGRFEQIDIFSDNVELCLTRFQSHFGKDLVCSGDEAGASRQRGNHDAARFALRRLRQLARCGGAILTGRSSFGALAVSLGGIPNDKTTVISTS